MEALLLMVDLAFMSLFVFTVHRAEKNESQERNLGFFAFRAAGTATPEERDPPADKR